MTVSVKLFNRAGELVGPVDSAQVAMSDEEWLRKLTPEQFRITRDHGTEPAFCGTLLDNHLDGVYACICCNLPLFDANAKFNSGTGWPSFFQPVFEGNLLRIEDRAYGMRRIEIRCVRCDAHLGHVFPDGPKPTGERHCLNSEALVFVERSEIGTSLGER